MTDAVLLQNAQHLEKRIRTASGPTRERLVDEFFSALTRLRASGSAIPGTLRRVKAKLEEEAVENQFDNMPV